MYNKNYTTNICSIEKRGPTSLSIALIITNQTGGIGKIYDLTGNLM